MVNLESVWDRTSEFIGDHLADVTAIALLLIFAPLCLMGNLMPLITSGGTVTDWALGCVSLALAIVTLWGGLALTALVIDPVDWKTAARAGAGQLPVAVIVSLIEMVVMVLLVVPIFIALALGGIMPGRMPVAGGPMPGFGVALFILLYTLVLILAGILVVARLLLFNAALVAEDRGVSALVRSWRLTRGMTWKLIGVVLLYVLVSQVAGLATKTVFGAILGLLAAGDGPVNVATVTTATLSALVQMAFSVLATVFAARLFVAIRDVRETIVELV